MKFFVRLLTGCFLSIPITVVLTGGVENALQLVFFSIVCTAGIGLVFWIPAWWFLGMLVHDVVVRAVNGEPNQNSKRVSKPADSQPRDYRALKAYIIKAEMRGMGFDEMMRRLQQSGWEKADIKNAYQDIDPYTSPIQEA